MLRSRNVVPCGSHQAIHTGPYTFEKVIARMLHDFTGYKSCYMLSLKINSLNKLKDFSSTFAGMLLVTFPTQHTDLMMGTQNLKGFIIPLI
jgi:hypothetical protein